MSEILGPDGKPTKREPTLIVPSGVKMSHEPRGRIERLFAVYEETELKEKDQVLVQEARKAFMMGSWALLGLFKKMMDMPEVDGVALYGDLEQELTAAVAPFRKNQNWLTPTPKKN